MKFIGLSILSLVAAGCAVTVDSDEEENQGEAESSLDYAKCGYDVGSALWRFEETSGTTAYDSIGSSHGTYLNGPAVVGGPEGYARSFDGTNDYVNVANKSNLDPGTGDFSVSFCVMTTDTSSLSVIVDKRTEYSGPVQGYVIANYYGNILVQLATGGAWTNYITNAFIADGKWHSVLVTVDRDNVNGGTVRIDGAYTASFNPTGKQGSLSTSYPLRIGRRSDNPSWPGYFKGSLDEVMVFKRLLTDSEIQGYCDYGNPNISYVSTSYWVCASVKFTCSAGQTGFGWNGCGCGCAN